MNQDLDRAPFARPSTPLALTSNPAPGHILGDVDDDWEAAEVWLNAIRKNSRNGSQQTAVTYRYHLTKLRWYCEQIAGVTPSRWTVQLVDHFSDFLADLPEEALCAKGVNEGMPGWTPFRVRPAASSQADIKRCVSSMFSAWQKTGYIAISPMTLVSNAPPRDINTDRAVPPGLFELVLGVMAQEIHRTFRDRQMMVRDRFILEALRGLGLRASELIGARMSGFFQVSLPGTHKRYWLFRVSPKTAKGGKQRDIPVPRVVWDAFVAYRAAFGLPERPEANEDTLIILSPLTKELIINGKSIKRSADRRRFGDWREVATRQGLYRIVTARLETAAAMLTSLGRDSEAATLRMASPHWLRHAFGKALVLTGQHPREIAGAMGHASLDMAMIYTQQGAIDLINASERSNPGQLAVEDGV